jgi:hypothetical protein
MVTMYQQSIEAYDLPQRVASYEADMDLMHQNRSKVVQTSLNIMKPYDCFINADIHIAESTLIEQRVPALRVNGIVERAAERDERFMDSISTRRFLDDL